MLDSSEHIGLSNPIWHSRNILFKILLRSLSSTNRSTQDINTVNQEAFILGWCVFILSVVSYSNLHLKFKQAFENTYSKHFFSVYLTSRSTAKVNARRFAVFSMYLSVISWIVYLSGGKTLVPVIGSAARTTLALLTIFSGISDKHYGSIYVENYSHRITI